VEFQTGDATAVLVTEQPGGRPLADVFGSPGTPYPCFVLDAVLHGLPTLVQALTALHARQHAHRVLAPPALLVAARGNVVLRDLGLATQEPTPGEGLAGYRAPEQNRPLLVPPGPHTDVYQLAAIVYHLATGQLATRQPAGPTPVPPSVLRPDLSPRLDRPLLVALATDVARRGTLGQLHDELGGIVRAGGTAVTV
jgi:serine/threonine protein kinase